MEQDALNATLQGRLCAAVAALQFHGRLLPPGPRAPDSTRSCCISSTRPKPWTLAEWKGEARFAEAYRDWFRTSPWPEWAEAPERPGWRRSRPPLTRVRREFGARLAAIPRSDALHRRSAAARRLTKAAGCSRKAPISRAATMPVQAALDAGRGFGVQRPAHERGGRLGHVPHPDDIAAFRAAVLVPVPVRLQRQFRPQHAGHADPVPLRRARAAA